MRWQIEQHVLAKGMDYNLPMVGIAPDNPADLVSLYPAPHLKSRYGWVLVGNLGKPYIAGLATHAGTADIMIVTSPSLCIPPRKPYDSSIGGAPAEAVLVFSTMGFCTGYDASYIFPFYVRLRSDGSIYTTNPSQAFGTKFINLPYLTLPACPVPSMRALYPLVQYDHTVLAGYLGRGTGSNYVPAIIVHGHRDMVINGVTRYGFGLYAEETNNWNNFLQGLIEVPHTNPWDAAASNILSTVAYWQGRGILVGAPSAYPTIHGAYNTLYWSDLYSHNWRDTSFVRLSHTNGMVLNIITGKGYAYVVMSDGTYILTPADEPYVFIPQLVFAGVTIISRKTVARFEDTLFILAHEGLYILAGNSAKRFSEALNPILRKVDIDKHPYNVPVGGDPVAYMYPPAHWVAASPDFVYVHLDMPVGERDRLYAFTVPSAQLTSFELPPSANSSMLLTTGVCAPCWSNELLAVDSNDVFTVSNAQTPPAAEIPSLSLWRLKYGENHSIRYQSRWWHMNTTQYKRLQRIAFHGNIKTDKKVKIAVDYAIEHPDAGYQTYTTYVSPETLQADMDITARWFRFTLECENVQESDLFALVLHYKPRALRH
ncbi:MAG: hypothetical protein QXH20_07330 [Candidatus Bathyarchaeia archaeon]